MSGVFIGLDFDSSEIHLVGIDEDQGRPEMVARYALGSGPGDAFERARRVADLFPSRSAWEDAGVLAVGLEDVYTRHLSSLVAHKRVEGALLACLPRGIAVYPLRPQTWKRLALGDGHGNAPKTEVRAWVDAELKALAFPPFLSQGFVDAYAIARATAFSHENATPKVARLRGGRHL